MLSSSSSLESTMDVSGNPASFSMRAAWMVRWARSPESSRMPIGRCPLRLSSSKTAIALGMPLPSVSIVSTSSTQSSG